MSKEIRKQIINGEIDPNNSELFFGNMLKGALLFLNDTVKLRGKQVPHFILNTGDEVLYRELMHYEYDKTKITDEDFIYNAIPRCLVTPADVTVEGDQLTQPYSRGVFEIEKDGHLYEFSAETRRLPIKTTIGLKYYVDSFSDALALSQMIMTNVATIRIYKFSYMGETMEASLTFPDSVQTEHPTELSFDTENRYKTLTLELELSTNMPVYNVRTAVETGAVIKTWDNNIGVAVTGEEYIARRHKVEPTDNDVPVDTTPNYIKKNTSC